MSQQVNVGSLVADLQVEDKATPALAKARKAMEQIAGELQQLESDLKSQAISMQAYSARVAQLQAAQAQLAAAMSAAYSKASVAGNALGVLNAGLAGNDSAAQRAARSLMHVGYVVDDLQYSFMAAVNNVGPLAYAMGAGPGLAGAVQLAAVGAAQLYQDWDQVKAALGDTSGIEKARESVKGMEKSIADLSYAIDTAGQFTFNPFATKATEGDVEKLRKDRDQLETMRRAEDAARAMQKAPTEDEKKAIDRFQGLVSQFEQKGGPGGIEGLARSMGDRDLAAKGVSGFLDEADQAKLADREKLLMELAQTGQTSPAAERDIKGLREKARKAAEDAARKRLAEGSLDGVGRERIRQELAKSGTPEEQELARLMGGGQTKKEKEESDKKAEEARKKAEEARERQQKDEQERGREFRRNNLELARQLMPSIEEEAKQAQDLIDLGTADRDIERARIASSLEARGMRAEDASLAARDIMGQQSRRDPAARARERDQALAAARSEQEQAQRERGQRAQEAITRGEFAIPGLKDRVQEQVAAATVGGGTLADVAARIRRELLASGAATTQEEAADAATSLAKEGRKSLAERVRQAALGGGESSQSQTMAASDLARTAQAGVASNDTRKYMERAVELLGEMARNGQNVLNVRID